MKTIWMVITNSGHGSNSALVINDIEVLNKMQKLADDGDERYASSDGLQVRDLTFPDNFDVDSWVLENFYGYYCIDNV